MIRYTWILFVVTVASNRPTCFDNFEMKYPSPDLCGNGRIDPGETCDDGNLINNDGCDSTCSLYDAFSTPCTLAGRNVPCPYGQTVFASTKNPTKTSFCNLRALSIHPLGRYLLLADNNLLLRYNLFTDDIAGTLTPLPINTLFQSFEPFCSLHVLEDSSILTYECTGAHRIGMVSPSYNNFISLKKIPALLPNPNNFKMLYLPSSQQIAWAGVSKQSNNTATIAEFRVCIEIYMMKIPPSFSSAVNVDPDSPIIPWMTIPCVVYNAFESDNTKYLTFDMTSMIPNYILYEPCVQSYLLDQKCIVVYMHNTNLQRVTAYIPENGGLDIHYTVHSNNLMDNALGFPRRKYSQNMNVLYTLRGSCFQSQQLVSKDYRLYVDRTLGNVCDKISSNSQNQDCVTPLNNPFGTDILTSQNLVPEGLISSNTHWELSRIFSNLECNMSSTTPTLSGAMYYRNILENVYGNTLPTDFEENPYTKDIFYITPTTLGLIGTKRFNLLDPKNLGYCKATNMIACPNAYYGSIDTGVCFPCNSSSSPGYGISVAWQIKCALSELKSKVPNTIPDAILANSHQPTMESYSNFVSKDITDMDLHASICLLLKVLKKPCPISLDIISREQHNTAADEFEFQSTSNAKEFSQTTLIKCLIQKTENTFNINITNDENAEYIARWITTGTNIIDSLSIDFSNFFTNFVPKTEIQTLNFDGRPLSTNETDILLRCFYNKNMNKLSYWLKCSIPLIAKSKTAPSGRRRLLQNTQLTSNSEIFINENNALSLISSTPVIFNPSSKEQNDIVIATQPASSNSESFPLWTGVGVGIAGALVVIVLLFCFYYRKTLSNKND